MTEPTGDTAPPSEDREPGDRLPMGARIAATVFGLTGTGAGGWAVFSTDNQAGTATLLLIGAVLLLIGVQGTPLRRLGHGDSSIDLAAVRQRAARVVERAVREQPPDVAAAVADAVETITPQIGPPLEIAYEDAVIEAIRRVGGSIDPTHRLGSGDKGVDARVTVGHGKVNVQIKLRRRGSLGARDIQYAADRAEASGFDGGFLLVTNAPLSDDARAYNAAISPTEGGVEAITWNDTRDDGLLTRALARNAR